MRRINLKTYGLQKDIHLEGRLVETFQLEQAQLIFLFDENHNYRAGIGQSLRNAIRLIDSAIVDFVAVEGFKGNLKPVVELEWKKAGFASLEQASKQLTGGRMREKAIIEMGTSFARALALLRPKTPVYGIEDMNAYQRAGNQIRKWERSIGERAARTLGEALRSRNCLQDERTEKIRSCLESREFIEELLRQSTTETIDFIKTHVQGERPHYFIENFFKYRNETGSRKASIMNAGRMEQDAVSEILRESRLASFLRLRPHPFPDRYEDLRNFWRARLPALQKMMIRSATDWDCDNDSSTRNSPDEHDAR